jgi:hypothetical protein
MENVDVIREMREALSPLHQVHVDRDAEDAMLVAKKEGRDRVVGSP